MRLVVKVVLVVALCLVMLPKVVKSESMTSGLYPNADVGFWSCDLGYRSELDAGITGFNSGLFIESGLNVGRFFHPELVISLFGGIAPVWGSTYKSEFLDKLHQYYELPGAYSELQDKVLAGSITEEESRELNALETGISRMQALMYNHPEGNASFYYGMMFRYPHKYAPIIKIYSMLYSTNMGSTSSGLQEVGGGTVKTARPLDRFGWGMEMIVFRGYTVGSMTGIGQFNVGYVSLFFESLDLKNSRIYYNDNDPTRARDLHLNEFVNDEFFNTFGEQEYKIGLKIGIHLM